MRTEKELEKELTEGLVENIYIDSIIVEPENRRITLKFLKFPELNRAVKTLTFYAIQNFNQVWDNWPDYSANDLDSLIGLHEFPQEPGSKYVLKTENREITFYTKLEPIIEKVD
jgi:hypothetical protein